MECQNQSTTDRGRKPEDFGQFLGWEAFSSWLLAFSVRLEGNKRRELIANLTSELPIKWHNRKQESLAGRCRAREKSFRPNSRYSVDRPLSACVFRIYEAIIYWDFPVRNVNKREERNWNKFKENKKKSFAGKQVNLWLFLSGSFTAGARNMGQKKV